ncbi:hypothetical protein EV14_2627 [Prochlorococcus sp. MIT 0703]|nr:hypothetical protein EV14_2627 [Prochlorococcus sp. MIT 0703]
MGTIIHCLLYLCCLLLLPLQRCDSKSEGEAAGWMQPAFK